MSDSYISVDVDASPGVAVIVVVIALAITATWVAKAAMKLIADHRLLSANA